MMEKQIGRLSLCSKILVFFLVVLLTSLSDGLLFAQAGKNPDFVQTFPMPGYFRNNVFTRDFVPSSAEQVSDLITRLTQNGKVAISERDVIGIALQNNLDIQVERQNTPAAQYDVLKSYGPFDPIFKASANTDRSTRPSASFLQTGVFGAVQPVDSLNQNFNFSYLQMFETGTNAEIDYFNSKSFTRSKLASLNPSITSQLKFSFLQPLLKNRGIGVNSEPIKVARNTLGITKENFTLQVINIINQALNTYWELVFDREDVKVKEASLALATKTNEDNKRQVEIGTLAPIDVVQSETAVASRQQDLIVSQYTLVQTEDTLKRFLSGARDPGAIIAKLEPVDQAKPPAADEKILPVPEAINTAIGNRSEIKQARLDLENRNLRLGYTKNQLLPEVDLSAYYLWTGLAGNSQLRDANGNPVYNSDGTPVLLEAGYRDATHQLLSFGFPEYAFGISLTIPLKNKSAEADFGRASYELRQSQARLALQEQQIALQVRNAHTVLEMNRARIDAATRTRQLQERTLDAENKKYQLGASTIRFVLQEQTNLSIDQTNEVRALVDYIKSKISLATAQGRLLQDFNIQVEDVLAGNDQAPKKPSAGLMNVNLTTGGSR
jgi:outer membrane protein